ncbi:MAG: NTP transferase domain-containing protein [Candidatus Bathyarchaeia archaeon]
MSITAIVMAGGRGKRLKLQGVEKPLVPLQGRPLIEYVVSALKGAREVHDIIVAVSPRNQATKHWAAQRGLETVETPGKGYVMDAHYTLRKRRLQEALFVASDLPLLTSGTINAIISFRRKAAKPCLVTCVKAQRRNDTEAPVTSAYFTRVEGVRLRPVGINIISLGRTAWERLPEAVFVLEEAYEAVNINTLESLRWAEQYLGRKKRHG